MMRFPKKADFYERTATQNDYGEDVYSSAFSFSTGVRLKTLSFKEEVKNTGTVDTTKFYCYTRKNPNTLSVSEGDYVKVDGSVFEVTGVDPMHGVRGSIMFLLDLLEDTVV